MNDMNVFQRINAVRKDIGYIQKNKSVSTGGGSYMAVTHDAVIGILREHLIKHGVVVMTSLESGEFDQKEEGSKQRLYRATFNVVFINEDKPADQVAVIVPAHAMDNADKAPGKAMSYATKYALLKTFNIETGEDEESRYQQEEYDFAAALTRAEAASKELAREILKEAKQKAVVLKDAAAIKAVDAVGKKLAAKFAKDTEAA